MAREQLAASKNENLDNTFGCGISIDTNEIILLYNPPIQSESRVPNDVFSNCSSSIFNDLSNSSTEDVIVRAISFIK